MKKIQLLDCTLRDGGYVFLNEVKMWCRLPKDRENRKSDYEEQK